MHLRAIWVGARLRQVTEEELSTKFVQERELVFGGLDAFNAGLEAVVGPPNPKLFEAIQSEHTQGDDAWDFFRTNNYGIKTKPGYEWWFVFDSEKGREILSERDPKDWKESGSDYPVEELCRLPRRKHRFAVPLESFEASLAGVNAWLRRKHVPPLRLEELVCCRLYTGPMFFKFNVVCRGAGHGKPQWAVDQFKSVCKGNRYSTTISAVNSAIIKLSKQTKVAKVYRGISGCGLPKMLTTKNEHNVIGGVEFAFLSTTLDRDVALKCASTTRCCNPPHTNPPPTTPPQVRSRSQRPGCHVWRGARDHAWAGRPWCRPLVGLPVPV